MSCARQTPLRARRPGLFRRLQYDAVVVPRLWTCALVAYARNGSPKPGSTELTKQSGGRGSQVPLRIAARRISKAVLVEPQPIYLHTGPQKHKRVTGKSPETRTNFLHSVGTFFLHPNYGGTGDRTNLGSRRGRKFLHFVESGQISLHFVLAH